MGAIIMNTTEKAKAIRRIIKDAGYDFTASFNDRLKGGGRRLKCMINRHDYGDAKYQQWERTIVDQLSQQGVDVISCKFETLHRPGYGDYKAMIVRFD